MKVTHVIYLITAQIFISSGTIITEKEAKLVLETVTENPRESMNNNGFFEETFNDNRERECVEEICSHEEFSETDSGTKLNRKGGRYKCDPVGTLKSTQKPLKCSCKSGYRQCKDEICTARDKIRCKHKQIECKYGTAPDQYFGNNCRCPVVVHKNKTTDIFTGKHCEKRNLAICKELNICNSKYGKNRCNGLLTSHLRIQNRTQLVFSKSQFSRGLLQCGCDTWFYRSNTKRVKLFSGKRCKFEGNEICKRYKLCGSEKAVKSCKIDSRSGWNSRLSDVSCQCNLGFTKQTKRQVCKRNQTISKTAFSSSIRLTPIILNLVVILK